MYFSLQFYSDKVETNLDSLLYVSEYEWRCFSTNLSTWNIIIFLSFCLYNWYKYLGKVNISCFNKILLAITPYHQVCVLQC